MLCLASVVAFSQVSVHVIHVISFQTWARQAQQYVLSMQMCRLSRSLVAMQGVHPVTPAASQCWPGVSGTPPQ